MERKNFILLIIINIIFYALAYAAKDNQWMDGKIYGFITKTALAGWFWALSLGLILKFRGHGETR